MAQTEITMSFYQGGWTSSLCSLLTGSDGLCLSPFLIIIHQRMLLHTHSSMRSHRDLLFNIYLQLLGDIIHWCCYNYQLYANNRQVSISVQLVGFKLRLHCACILHYCYLLGRGKLEQEHTEILVRLKTLYMNGR